MSYLTQMAASPVHNFISAAAGIAVAIALARGFARPARTDDHRQLLGRPHPGTVYILLPLSFVFALVSFAGDAAEPRRPTVKSTTLEGASRRSHGPVASQEAIKQLGTNGGGFFNANSAHPFESPNAAHELPLDVPDLPDPGRPRPTRSGGWRDSARGGRCSAAMTFLFFAGVTVAYWAEAAGNPILKGASP